MRYLWSRFIIIFLVIEVIAFVLYYNFGPRGVVTLRALAKIKTDAQADIKKIACANDDVREQIEEWKHDSFFQEKFAREKLALQKENEIIYFR